MTKVSSTLLDELSGKLGKGVVFRQTAHGTVMAKAGRRNQKRSELQAEVRCRFANVSANYRLYAGKLMQAFEGKGAGVSDFNQYLGVNFSNPVFITKGMRVAGCCVLADYTFTVGSLQPIGMALNGSGVLVSDLALGSLVIDEHTTVSDLSLALIAENEAWEEGDQLTFFYGSQYMDAQGMPRATMVAKKVILSVDDETGLWEAVGSEGFTSIASAGSGTVLGMSVALENSGAAWVHSRDKVSGDTLVSTQQLVVVSDILDSYRTYAAMKASADSYGGINSKRVYLNPMSEASSFSMTSNSSNPSMPSGSGGGESPAGGETQTPSGGSGDSQTPSGGSGESQSPSGGESQAVTVAAPVISGTTPFEDTTSVTIMGPDGAEIRYTTDGSTPTGESTLYSGAFGLSDTTTVKAIAVIGETSSEVTSKVFTKEDDGGLITS